ncbi:MAG: PAS domain-containing protein [Actinobacteria bacterium]|nr:PAS domain-containing protein [Actinomycetota bacterium]
MPSIRLPFTRKKHLASGAAEIVLSSPGVSGTAPQPPLTYDDPRLRAFLGVTFDVLYDWNIATGAIYFSERLDHILGLPAGGFPRTLEGWLEHVHRGDHENVGDALGMSVTTQSPFRCEYRLRHRDGTYRVVEDQGLVMAGEDGAPASMIGAMRDVTGEREAQLAAREATELHRVLFRLPSPAVQVAKDGSYIDADANALAFFERTAEEMLAANVRDDFPEEVVAAMSGAPGSEAIAELDVTCHVRGKAKSLLLSVIPAELGDELTWFLLGADITGQRAMQDELARSERALRRQARILDERNTALKVLLEQREQDRRELEGRIVQNVEQLIEPTLDRLSRALRHQPERLEVEALRVNLREIVGPFGERLARAEGTGQPLTRREAAVANFVRLGKTTDEIAETLHISRSTVSFHRANVRRKMGLPRGGPTLSTHLANLGRS